MNLSEGDSQLDWIMGVQKRRREIDSEKEHAKIKFQKIIAKLERELEDLNVCEATVKRLIETAAES